MNVNSASCLDSALDSSRFVPEIYTLLRRARESHKNFSTIVEFSNETKFQFHEKQGYRLFVSILLLSIYRYSRNPRELPSLSMHRDTKAASTHPEIPFKRKKSGIL